MGELFERRLPMGVTIHYRGQMADLDRVEEFEDRVLDMALEISAPVQVWRSAAEDNPTRMVRGLLLDLVPGQETTSLLLSPEGWLIPLTEIQAAEKTQLTEPPLCCVLKRAWRGVAFAQGALIKGRNRTPRP